MTKEEILATGVGLELDRLVEEVIFDHKGAKIIREYSSVWVGSIPSPFYSTNISAAWQVEEKVAELGLQSAYIKALANLVERVGSAILTFSVVHASPELRCKAALLAKLEPENV